MDLEARKLSFIQEIIRIENQDLIEGLEKILLKWKAELYEKNLKPMSIEQFNSDIDKSLEDSKNDRVISAQDLKEEIKKWK